MKFKFCTRPTRYESRLRELTDAAELERLSRDGEVELAEPGRWGTTFTLLQCWGYRPGDGIASRGGGS